MSLQVTQEENGDEMEIYDELCIDDESDVFVNNSYPDSGFTQNLNSWPNTYPVVWPLPSSEEYETQMQPSENSSRRESTDGANFNNPKEVRSRTSSLVNGLLTELYDTYRNGPGSALGLYHDSVDSSTEASGSDAFLSRSNPESGFLLELSEKQSRRHQIQFLRKKDCNELKAVREELRHRIGVQSAKLLRQLKQKDRLQHKVQKKSDIVTACLQAVSQKRREYLSGRKDTGYDLMLKYVFVKPYAGDCMVEHGVPLTVYQCVSLDMALYPGETYI